MAPIQPNLTILKAEPADELTALDDNALMRLACAEHKRAFEELVSRHHSWVIRFASRFLNDASLGRDVAQDVFLMVWAERHRYRGTGSFAGYIYKVTRNRCYVVCKQERQRGKRHQEFNRQHESRPQTNADTPLAEILSQERRHDLQQRLSVLPKPTLEVMILRFCQGRQLSEISELTGIPLGTVKSHVFRGVQKLRDMAGKVLP